MFAPMPACNEQEGHEGRTKAATGFAERSDVDVQVRGMWREQLGLERGRRGP